MGSKLDETLAALNTVADTLFEGRGGKAAHQARQRAERAAAEQRRRVDRASKAAASADDPMDQGSRSDRKSARKLGKIFTSKTLTVLGVQSPKKVAPEWVEEATATKKADKKKPGSRAERFRQKRREGRLKRHKERIVITKDDKGKLRGKSKFANSGTFRPCTPDAEGREGSLHFRRTGDQTPRKGGAMISNKGLRQRIPRNQFVNRDPENPTGPIRPKCRASLAGVLRSRSFPGTGKSYDKSVEDRINKLNKKKDSPNISAHKLGERQKKHHGPSGAATRHPKYGELTGRADKKPHTAKREWGKRYNRPVVRALGDDAPKKAQVRVEKSKSGKKQKREAKREKAAGKRGEKALGRTYVKNPHLSKEREPDEGKKLAVDFKGRSGKSKVTGKGKKKRRQKH